VSADSSVLKLYSSLHRKFVWDLVGGIGGGGQIDDGSLFHWVGLDIPVL
jgi:hypothetical protein